MLSFLEMMTLQFLSLESAYFKMSLDSNGIKKFQKPSQSCKLILMYFELWIFVQMFSSFILIPLVLKCITYINISFKYLSCCFMLIEIRSAGVIIKHYLNNYNLFMRHLNIWIQYLVNGLISLQSLKRNDLSCLWK